MRQLSQERLKQILRLDLSTGLFHWIESNRRYKAGDVASSLDQDGYRIVGIDRQSHFQHRLVWLYLHGCMPSDEIDHINGIASDNRPENLRCVSHRVNMQNRRKAHRHSRSGLAGVLIECGRKPRAYVTIDSKNIYLGSFDTPEEAHQAFLKAKREMHEGCTI